MEPYSKRTDGTQGETILNPTTPRNPQKTTCPVSTPSFKGLTSYNQRANGTSPPEKSTFPPSKGLVACKIPPRKVDQAIVLHRPSSDCPPCPVWGDFKSLHVPKANSRRKIIAQSKSQSSEAMCIVASCERTFKLLSLLLKERLRSVANLKNPSKKCEHFGLQQLLPKLLSLLASERLRSATSYLTLEIN